MDRRHQKGRQAGTETARLDPIALSIAIWLGLLVAVAGFTRIVQIQDSSSAVASPAISTIY